MIRTTPRRVWSLSVVVLMTAFGASGCAGLSTGELSLLGSAGDDAAAAKSDAAAISLPKYSVEIYPDAGQPQRVEAALDGTTFVQGALEKTGATKRFRKMNVFVIRANSDGAGKHRMDVTYDSAKRRVASDTDYALHPGDRIVVVEDTSTFVEKMLGPMLGPLGAMGGRR
jgi:hypothetical protein